MDYAILVGINAYPPPNQLHGCLNDVQDVAGELKHAFYFRPANIALVTDADATAAAIKQALSDTVAKLKTGDRFLFWYSGHGSQLVDGDAATDVICPVDFNFTPETSVTVDDFHDIFSGISPDVTAAWGSDSCHSGDLEREFYRAGVPRLFDVSALKGVTPPSAPATRFKRFRDISITLPHIALISGCRSDQTSADAYIDNRYNGAFTYFFLQQLRSAGGMTTPLQTLVPEVQSALKAAHYDQIPQLSGPPQMAAAPFLGAPGAQ